MYKKGAALELQFSPNRLNSGAGDPYWVDLTAEEARKLHDALSVWLARDPVKGADPLVVTLDPVSEDVAPDVKPAASADNDLKQWVCLICGWIYDEAEGDPEHGIAPGTRWCDVPDDFRCPLCDVGKEDFALIEF
ncbi:rubredoxin [Caballeronia sp. BR00000012568055]|uniref:rubredoxin n=1 Tax=Caballeronia sp. BR00000012568055 TaxID=2918761 RepID=UPI0023F7DEA0|nr:rubredoxin [Caballeronia sp. BR00000012568055]